MSNHMRVVWAGLVVLGLMLGEADAVFFGIGTAYAGGEPKMLFKFVDMANVPMSDKQARILDRVKNSPATMDLHVAEFRIDLLNKTDGEPLLLNMQPGKSVVLKGYEITKSDGFTKLAWHAKPDASVTLSISRDRATGRPLVTGLIYHGEEVYAVEPLGGGLQAISHIDQSKFKEINAKSKKDK